MLLSWLTRWRLDKELNLLEEIDFDDCNSLQCLQLKMKSILGKDGKFSQILKNFHRLYPNEREKMSKKINSAKEILELKYQKRLENL